MNRPLDLACLCVSIVVAGVAVSRVSAEQLVVDEQAVKTFNIEVGEIAELEIPLRYDGAEPVRVTKVLGSCGCSKASVKAGILKPGTTTPLLVSFDSRGRAPGPLEVSFVVVTERNKYQLKEALSVNLQRNIVVDQALLRLGELEPGSEAEHKCDILIKGGFPIDNVKAVSSCDDLHVTLTKGDEKGREFSSADKETLTVCSMTIRLSTEGRRGPVDEHVDLTFKGYEGRNPTIRVPVAGKILEPVNVSPQRAFLGLIRPKSSAQVHLRIVSPKGAKIQVTSIEGPEYVKANYVTTAEEKGRIELDAKLEIGSTPEAAGTILLEIDGNASGEPFTLRVPCVFVATQQ